MCRRSLAVSSSALALGAAALLTLGLASTAHAQAAPAAPTTAQGPQKTPGDAAEAAPPTPSLVDNGAWFSSDGGGSGSTDSLSASADAAAGSAAGSWSAASAPDAFRIGSGVNSSSVSVTFVGVAFPADVTLWSVQASTFVGSLATGGQATSAGAVSGALGGEMGLFGRSSGLEDVTPSSLLGTGMTADVIAAPVPEPAAGALMLLGLAALAVKRRR